MIFLYGIHHIAIELKSHIVEGKVVSQKNSPFLQENDKLTALTLVLPELAYAHSLCRMGTSWHTNLGLVVAAIKPIFREIKVFFVGLLPGGVTLPL